MSLVDSGWLVTWFICSLFFLNAMYYFFHLWSSYIGQFWQQGLPVHFCKTTLPKSDVIMNLVGEEGDEYPTVFLARKSGLSGGWKRFSVAHKLVDGDALVFQLVRPTKFKVIIELHCRLSTFIIPTMEYFWFFEQIYICLSACFRCTL